MLKCSFNQRVPLCLQWRKKNTVPESVQDQKLDAGGHRTTCRATSVVWLKRHRFEMMSHRASRVRQRFGQPASEASSPAVVLSTHQSQVQSLGDYSVRPPPMVPLWNRGKLKLMNVEEKARRHCPNGVTISEGLVTKKYRLTIRSQIDRNRR